MSVSSVNALTSCTLKFIFQFHSIISIYTRIVQSESSNFVEYYKENYQENVCLH